MPITIYQVDAFTVEPFKGNPAVVCLLDEERAESWMQSVTAEINLSDTAFLSRYFAPHWGVDEDPVTGSAHCALLPYWSHILGRCELIGYQASHRGGVVYCRLADDRAIIAGHAVTILRGELV